MSKLISSKKSESKIKTNLTFDRYCVSGPDDHRGRDRVNESAWPHQRSLLAGWVGRVPFRWLQCRFLAKGDRTRENKLSGYQNLGDNSLFHNQQMK